MMVVMAMDQRVHLEIEFTERKTRLSIQPSGNAEWLAVFGVLEGPAIPNKGMPPTLKQVHHTHSRGLKAGKFLL
jgi:hypothetical protein